MILVTGGTGFIGQALVRQLVEAGYPVRVLIRPSGQVPKLPRGIPLEIAVSSLKDERGIQSAMNGVETVYHLIGGEWRGARADLLQVDIQGTQAVLQAAVRSGVQRFFYLSHLDADRASAYPVLKAKGIAEEFVRHSGIAYTIFRSAIVFGMNDAFTHGLARLLRLSPGFFLLPGDGQTLLQPLWVEDLATCLTWALENPSARDQTYEVGGPEFLSFSDIVSTIAETIGLRRRLIPLNPPYLRLVTLLLEHTFSNLPVSVFWLDYLATNRTCALDTLPRLFHLMPARFSQRLDHLTGKKSPFNR